MTIGWDGSPLQNGSFLYNLSRGNPPLEKLLHVLKWPEGKNKRPNSARMPSGN